MDILIDNIFEIAIVLIFLVILYRGFCRKPKIKVIKAPTTAQIHRERKRARRRRKLARWFRVPRIGRAEVIEYDKTNPYIESIWEEMRKK